jgi:hypothetical protein
MEAACPRRGARREFVKLFALVITTTAVAVAAMGCGDEEGAPNPPVLDTYLGTVAGSDAYVALITDGEEVAGYVSNGGGLSTWLATSRLDNGRAPLASREGLLLGEASVSRDRATGQIRLGPESLRFDAKRAIGDAGLYFAAQQEGEDVAEIGWILMPDGSQRGSVFSIVDGEQSVAPAPRLRLRDPSVTVGQFSQMVPTELTTRYLERNDHFSR